MTDENISIRWDVAAGHDVIRFTSGAYVHCQTHGQSGSVDIALDRKWMKILFSMLRDWNTVTSYIGKGDSDETPDDCSHENTWFDRSVCPEPCGGMHNYCIECSNRMEDCPAQDFLYDGQNMNEPCVCGHAAMVHTSGSGNCLAFGTSSQEESHCLKFVPPRPVDNICDGCCSDTCACGDVPMTPIDVCTACLHSDPHDTGGIGVCRAHDCGCDGPDMCPKCGHDANLHGVGGLCPEDGCECFEPLDPCGDCGHGTIHAVGTPGVLPQYCEFEGCDCTGRETFCHECPHSLWQHQQGDGGCPHCDCRVGEKVKPPVLDLCDECHGEVYTFPKAVVALEQRLEHPNDMWATFFYTDTDGDRLEISDGHTDDNVIGVNFHTAENGVFVPLDALEAVISAIRETGHRSIKGLEFNGRKNESS